MNREYREFFNEFFCWRMQNNLVPSLQHATMVKIATELWNQSDLRESIVKYRFIDDHSSNWKKWREIEEKALFKAAQLPLPEVLKKKIISAISPIGVEIRNWWRCHQYEIHILKLPDRFTWTPDISIDRKRTAEMLVKDETFDVETRYQLACINCLEDDVPELWNQIPEQRKLYFYSNPRNRIIRINKIVDLWTCSLICKTEGNGRSRAPSHAHAFSFAVAQGNAVATEFFFDKLSDEERNTLLVRHAKTVAQQRSPWIKPEECYSSVFFFLLSKMSEDQQVQLLVECPFVVLSCFLDRPYQLFFKDLAEAIMSQSLFPRYSYISLLLSITHKIATGCADFDYRQLFVHFWNTSPLVHKRYVVGYSTAFCFLVFHLLEAKEKVIVKMLFECTDVFDRKRFIFRDGIVRRFVDVKHWDALKFFIEVCEPTKEVLVEVKDQLKSLYYCHVNRREGESGENGSQKNDALSHVLDELIAMKSE